MEGSCDAPWVRFSASLEELLRPQNLDALTHANHGRGEGAQWAEKLKESKDSLALG